jgi:asparagine synthase (glutamine-hydrolysing)
MKVAAETVDVLIDGQGPDELLCGYIAYQATYVKTLWRNGYRFKALKELMGSLWYHGRFWYRAYRQHPDTSNVNVNLADLMYDDLTVSSIPGELYTLQKSAEALGIKVVSPYLDDDLVEYFASLPLNVKIRNGVSKWILRESIRGLVPESVRTRQTKLGFPAPEASWMKNELRPMVERIIDSRSFHNRPYWSGRYMSNMYHDYVNGRRPYDRKLWRVICTELWLQMLQ